jgi:hypothetical protein
MDVTAGRVVDASGQPFRGLAVACEEFAITGQATK